LLLAQSKEAKPMIKALTAIALLLALGAAALAKQTPVEPADINIGSVGAMRENIGSVGAMRERDYFQAPQSPFNASAFPCRLEPDLFHKTRLAQSCR
jgi:predicted permease